MSDALQAKLADLPKSPGVYFHKNTAGEIIYVGKAAVLRNRVRQYFQASRNRDPKTEALVLEINDVDWIEVQSEIEALFLEAEMIRRYMPRYNILLRDDKSNLYVRIDMKNQYPTVTYVRQPMDDGANYLGPYLSGFSVRRALKYLRKIFPYSTHAILPKRACLQYHLGLCPGPETGQLDSATYKANLKKLVMYLKGERVQLANQLERDMQLAAKNQQFELAATIRNQ
ncbi:MAG: UvrB/UvrC motif-containing protein, partial [bacterium]|nr:UvrB/UvrC motif-containing protein [bacterium]